MCWYHWYCRSSPFKGQCYEHIFRRQPLLSIANCIFKTVHAPVQMAPPLMSTPIAGQQAFRPFTHTSVSGSYIVPNPGQFVYDDFLNGSGAIYVKLLRLVPTDLLVRLQMANLEDRTRRFTLLNLSLKEIGKVLFMSSTLPNNTRRKYFICQVFALGNNLPATQCF